MRTTEIGACMPATGRIPGMRRPVRTMTFPSTARRRIALGADVVFAFRRDRRGFQPEASALHRLRRFLHDAVLRRTAVFEREIDALENELHVDHAPIENAQRFEQ